MRKVPLVVLTDQVAGLRKALRQDGEDESERESDKNRYGQVVSKGGPLTRLKVNCQTKDA